MKLVVVLEIPVADQKEARHIASNIIEGEQFGSGFVVADCSVSGARLSKPATMEALAKAKRSKAKD